VNNVTARVKKATHHFPQRRTYDYHAKWYNGN